MADTENDQDQDELPLRLDKNGDPIDFARWLNRHVPPLMPDMRVLDKAKQRITELYGDLAEPDEKDGM